MINKRDLRKFAYTDRELNLKAGIFCAEQVKFVVSTAVHNIGGRRTLVLYVYEKESVFDRGLTPLWTVFQTKDEYITLRNDENGTRWQKAMINNLKKGCCDFISKCAFYSQTDEQRVSDFCKNPVEKGFGALLRLQWHIYSRKSLEQKKESERKIIERMKVVGQLPRDMKGFISRETLPQYIFYDYCKGKKEVVGYCTACRHEVEIAGAKHNKAGICPRCKKPITFKSRGKRRYITDRSTVQVIQRTGENELVVRFVKAYCSYCKEDTPLLSVYENARLFLTWNEGGPVEWEPFYYLYDSHRLTPWCKGERPVFSRYQYNFEADSCGYLYCRNLDSELEGTPWRYAALKEYYIADPTPLYVPKYLEQYLLYPMLEYLVKFRLCRLATYVVYGENDLCYFSDKVLNSAGRNMSEVLGVGKSYLPFLQEVNPGSKQLLLIKSMLRKKIQPDVKLMKWCSEYGINREEIITEPLRFMTPYKLMRYAAEQFATYKKASFASPGHCSMSDFLIDYKDYLCMCEALDYNMKSEFVLFPKKFKEAHDRVNDLSDTEVSEACDRKIAENFTKLQGQYRLIDNGLMVVPPRYAGEIIEEGQKLHHCVGNYIKDVVKNKCCILFIRRTEAPYEPYCTVELIDGKVVQARIQGNYTPPLKVQQFIEMWKQQVLYVPAEAA